MKETSEYQQVLIQFGLTDKESAAYLALLELGQADIADIAKQAGLKRPTCYFVIDDLVQKGFVSPAGGNVKHYIAEKPQKVMALEQGKLNQLEKALPGLIGLASRSRHKPSVRFFSGLEGIKAVYEESLLQPAGTEVLALGNAKAVEERLVDFGDWYIKRRVAGRIRLRALITDTPYHRDILARDKAELRQTRLLDAELFTQDVEINIYGDTVAMISFVEHELVGVVIKSKVFAAGHQQMFETLWRFAGLAQSK